MPIVPPLLDDRTWKDLRDEAIARVPIYTPEWTDTREGDPGVALVELFAYLTEALVYRLNRVPDNNYVAFLNLLDSPPRPAEPSAGLVQMQAPKLDVTFDGTQAPGLVGRQSILAAGSVQFSTDDSLSVLPIELAGYVKCHVQPPSPKDEAAAYAKAAFDAYTTGRASSDPTATFKPMHYVTKNYPPTDGSVLSLSRALDAALWIAVLVRSDDFSAITDPVTKVRKQLGGSYLSIGVSPSANQGRARTSCAAPDDLGGNRAVSQLSSARLRWEITVPAGLPGRPTALGWNQEPTYARVQLISDTTSGLTQPGVIKLKLPDDPKTWTEVQPADGEDPVPIASFPRAGDLPPVLDDGDVEQRVIVWLRALPVQAQTNASPDASTQGTSSPCGPQKPVGATAALAPSERPRLSQALSWIGPNAVDVLQKVQVANEKVGVGTGQTNQQLQLAFPSVIAGSLQISVNEDGVDTPWTEVSDFDASDDRASVFTLDRALGIITFGDGLQGRVVPDGAQVTALAYWYGGGLAGNVPAGAITKFVSASPAGVDTGKTANPVATMGGSETETVDQARRRVPMILRHQNRAVTADDFRELASLTPGVNVGRVEVLPLYRPGAPANQPFPGVVTVLVIPSEDAAHPRAPEPDRNFREAVCLYLDKHRLLTTELHIIGPRYQQIGVSIGIKAKPGAAVEQLTYWICLALHQYFAPLPPYGPDGQGWPLGGKINRGAIEAAVLQVDGVAWVEELVLYRALPTGPVEYDTIPLAVIDLPELVQIDVDLDHAPPPNWKPELSPQPPPPNSNIPVPVPAPRTTC